MPALLPWVATLVGGVGIGRLLRLRRDAHRARQLAARAVAYERLLGDAGAALLVVGDSLSVGVGASTPEHSVAGRIAAACPGLTVVNRARSGARLADVPDQVRAAPRRRWSAVLLTIGGNDALRRTPPSRLREDARRAIAAVSAIAPHGVVATSANLAVVPIVPWPLTAVLERRSRRVRDAIAASCERLVTHGERGTTHFVDFFRPRTVDPFGRRPERYFGPDRVHPSSHCYGVCFRMIERRTGLAATLRWGLHAAHGRCAAPGGPGR